MGSLFDQQYIEFHVEADIRSTAEVPGWGSAISMTEYSERGIIF